MKTLLIIDGNSILNRAFYGVSPLSTKDGLPTNAIYGFVNILKKHMDNYKADYLICTFDVKQPTFRHKMYKEYKGTRKGMPEDLAKQLPYAKEAASLLGFFVAECPGYEADDEIGTICAYADSLKDIKSYIVTGDRDSLQLITENTSVNLVKTKGDIVYDRNVFFTEYSVYPEQFIDVKALMGDSSDNIPGIPGVGEKTAFKLINENSSLDNLYSSIDTIKLSPALKEKLVNFKESAYLSKDLATICKNAPCIDEFEAFKTNGINKPALKEFFIKLEFTAFLDKFNLYSSDEEETKKDFIIPELIELDESEFIKRIINTPAIAINENKIYLSDKTNTYASELTDKIKTTIANNDFICHEVKKICKLLGDDFDISHCKFDTMLAAYLLSPGKSSYPISKIAISYINIAKENLDISEEVFIVSNLWEKLKEKLESENMLNVLLDIEIPLAKVLASMETSGFTIDCDKLKEYSNQLKIMEDDLTKQIYEQAGCEFNINSPKQLGDVLFNKLKLPNAKKTKTGYSTDAETLGYLRPHFDIVDDILNYRQISKLRNTYGETLWKIVDENNRIHTTFNQTGTATGRLSSVEPNLQNIPTRSELGREFRKYFVPSNNKYTLIDADYSQIELRLMAELSGDETMQNAFASGEDFHTLTASQVFKVPVDFVTSDLRRQAKAVNFGIIYGIGAYSLSQDLGISIKNAQEYITNYLNTYKNVDIYLNETIANAKRDGYTTTLLGRKRYIPELRASNKNMQAFGERVAMNSPIQGTAADIIKIAMIKVYNRLKEDKLDAKLILQVHDELIIEANKDNADKVCEILKECMENAIKTKVKLLAEVGIGDTWFDAH